MSRPETCLLATKESSYKFAPIQEANNSFFFVLLSTDVHMHSFRVKQSNLQPYTRNAVKIKRNHFLFIRVKQLLSKNIIIYNIWQHWVLSRHVDGSLAGLSVRWQLLNWYMEWIRMDHKNQQCRNTMLNRCCWLADTFFSVNSSRNFKIKNTSTVLGCRENEPRHLISTLYRKNNIQFNRTYNRTYL